MSSRTRPCILWKGRRWNFFAQIDPEGKSGHFFSKAPLTRLEADLSPKEANERLLNELTLGDIYPNALGKFLKSFGKVLWKVFGKVWWWKACFAEHFCQLTDEVIVPLFKNLGNMEKFPRCLVNDIKQQVKYINEWLFWLLQLFLLLILDFKLRLEFKLFAVRSENRFFKFFISDLTHLIHFYWRFQRF